MRVNRDLQTEYRAAWSAFSRRLNELQTLVEAGDRTGAQEALLAVEKARLAHNAARDRLAEHLGSEVAASKRRTGMQTDRHTVTRTAHLLWEVAGRPAGTAESDWHRAEALVRSASA